MGEELDARVEELEARMDVTEELVRARDELRERLNAEVRAIYGDENARA